MTDESVWRHGLSYGTMPVPEVIERVHSMSIRFIRKTVETQKDGFHIPSSICM